jgi:hypothetical protein
MDKFSVGVFVLKVAIYKLMIDLPAISYGCDRDFQVLLNFLSGKHGNAF